MGVDMKGVACYISMYIFNWSLRNAWLYPEDSAG